MEAVRDNRKNNDKKRKHNQVDESSRSSKTVDNLVDHHHYPSSSPKFLSYHLKMLRALYDEVEEEESSKSSRDTPVSPHVWNMIQRFLHERRELATIKDEAGQLRSIVNESASQTTKTINKLMTPVIGKRLFTSPSTSLKSSSTSTTPRQRSMAALSSLLNRRAVVAEGKARTMVRPFHDLYTAVCQRVQRCKTLLTDEQNNADDDDDDSAMKQQSHRMELDAKHRLWNMLANDLYNVVQI